MIRTRAAMPTNGRHRAAAASILTAATSRPNPPGLPSPSTGTNVGVLDTSPMRATSPPTSPNADAPVPASQPTRHTIRSRRSATAGQLLATRGGTTTARSSGSIGGIVRGHRADHRLNPGNTTSNRERMCSAR